MKLFRNSVLICLCLVLALSIAGCGGGSSKPKASNPEPTVTTPNQDPDQQPGQEPQVVNPTIPKDLSDPNIQVYPGYNDQFIVSPGSFFDVPVILSQVPEKGITAFVFSLKYDSSVLEFVDVTPAAMVTDLAEFDYYAGNIGLINFLYAPRTSFVTSDGVFVTVKLKVKEDAEPGNYQLVTEEGERGSFHTLIIEDGKTIENTQHVVSYKSATVVIK